MRSNMRANSIESVLEQTMSTDRVQAFKPYPDAYQVGPDAVGLSKEEIAVTAFAGCDAAGASWFG